MIDPVVDALRRQRDWLLSLLQEIADWVEQLERRFDLPSPAESPSRLDQWLVDLRHRVYRLGQRLRNVGLSPSKPRLERRAICDWPPCQQPFIRKEAQGMTCSTACSEKRNAWLRRNRIKVFGPPRRGRVRQFRLRTLPDFDPNL